jgi:hypothetical protein
MAEHMTASATVSTESPARYAKQLASHLGRRCEVREEPDGVRILVGTGDCVVRVGANHLELTATAPDGASLDTVTDVIGRHLERFGQRNELVVRWDRRGP